MSRKRGPEAGHFPTAQERDERHSLDMPFDEAARLLVTPHPNDGEEDTAAEREACLRRELDAIATDPDHQRWKEQSDQAWADGSAMREASTRGEIVRALAEDT